jgi:hypothetical protein
MSEKNFICSPAPVGKRKYISDLWKILVKEYGKKRYYKPKEVKKAHEKSPWSNSDFACWAMSTYSSRSDFDEYHQQTGEICDYTSMKAEMLKGISLTEGVHLSELPAADLDASWLDIGEIFEGLLNGVGDFFGGIADGFDD